MISRGKLDTLVERVIRRLTEANPAFVPTMPAPAMAPTEFPSHAVTTKTIPAGRSAAEKEANKELAGKNTRNPKASSLSPKVAKVNNIRKALHASGYAEQSGLGDQELTRTIEAWYDQLDPGDALVATADQLAQRFSQEGGH